MDISRWPTSASPTLQCNMASTVSPLTNNDLDKNNNFTTINYFNFNVTNKTKHLR